MNPISMVGIVLTFVSIWGYSGLIAEKTEQPFCALLLACCGIIIALMLGGLANLLLPMGRLVFAGGLACFIWVYVVRRRRVAVAALAAIAIGATYAWLHYRGTYFKDNDSASHWGLVVRYLVRENRFPDAGTRLIYFPTYPVGTGVFIWYLCRFAGDTGGGMLAAQMLLYCCALLPMLGLVRDNKLEGYALFGIVAVVLIAANVYHYSLQVDALLGYMTLGGTCVVWLNRSRPARALYRVLPVAVALAFIKSSGVVMALLLVGLAAAMPRGEGKGLKARQVAAALLAVAAAVALWQLHVRLAYGDNPTGKHAISARRWLDALREKDGKMILGVALRMLASLKSLDIHMFTLPIFCLALGFALFGGLERGLWLRRLRRLTVFAVVVFLAWYALLFLTYVFSMTPGEAKRLASLDRYRITGVVYVVGLFTAYALCYLSEAVIRGTPARRRWAVAAVLALFGVCACLPVGSGSIAQRLLDKGRDGRREYGNILELRERNEVEEGKRYIVFCRHWPEHPFRLQHVTKYEFYSNDLVMIYRHIANPQTGETLYASLKNCYMDKGDVEIVDNLERILAENIGDCDYVLVYEEDPAFEAALDSVMERYAPRANVCYSYKD